MKILIDECLPNQFRHELPEHEVHSVQWAGFSGKKNGELLRAASEASYDLFLTIDQGVPYQDKLSNFGISLDLEPLAGAIRKALAQVTPGRVIFVPAD